MPPKTWFHKGFRIDEGLKPGSRSFRYFFNVSEKDQKKCNYCIWIEDDALVRFGPSREFESIVSSFSGQWEQWAKDKIDANDFRDIVLRHDTKGEVEIDLEKMDKKLTVDLGVAQELFRHCSWPDGVVPFWERPSFPYG